MRKKFILSALSFLAAFCISCQVSAPGGGTSDGGGSEPGGGGSSSEGYVQSAEITKSGTSISARSGQSLYTITIHYPSGEYNGSGNASYTLKGSGSMKSVRSESLIDKAVPSGTQNWNDLWDNTDYGSGKFTGRYWFTDENNKIKFYVTSGSRTPSNSNVKSAWEGVLQNRNEAYWNELKNKIKGHKAFESNYLKSERDAFGLAEYDKDKTEYFYVIFCDFGVGSADESGGTAGVYSSKNIRNNADSNGADIFYVNARFVEVTGEDVDSIVDTLLHEYMHYLMDANRMLNAEKTNPDVARGYTREPASMASYYSAGLYGSSFWTEGTANYAPYRMLKSADRNAVGSWLRIMNAWRPAINDSDDSSNSGNGYAVYGAGGLFFSYIAEKYGSDTINSFHKYVDDPLAAVTALRSSTDANDYKNYMGNINRITKSVLNKDFKDIYVEFLCQCMSDLSDNVAIKGAAQKSYSASKDWGFVDITKTLAKSIPNASDGDSGSLPQLSFQIHKWNQIPEKISVAGDNIKCYAIWF